MSLLKRKEMSPTVRFALPVLFENILTMIAVQAAAIVIGRISRASLAATGMGNTIISFTVATFFIINTSTAVLISRLVGADDSQNAADTLEQAIGLLMLCSVALSTLYFTAARPLLRLLMPNAEDILMNEAVIYFRINALSFPFLMLETLLAGAMRAAGNSRSAMVLGLGMNVLMAVFIITFIRMGWGIYGAGLAYALARAIAAIAAVIIVARYHNRFHIHFRNVFRPRLSVYRHILRVGAPMALDQFSVQGGYVIANAMAVGLGTLNATVYQVCSNVSNIIYLPNSVCAATAQVMVGLLLGEGRPDEVKRVTRRVWVAGAVSVLGLSLLMACFGRAAASLYSDNEEVIRLSQPIIWLLVLMGIPAMSINTTEGALRASGDARFVMISSIMGIWLIRLPVTWLLAYHFNFGIMGVFIANFLNFLLRMSMGIARIERGKWIHKTM